MANQSPDNGILNYQVGTIEIANFPPNPDKKHPLKDFIIGYVKTVRGFIPVFHSDIIATITFTSQLTKGYLKNLLSHDTTKTTPYCEIAEKTAKNLIDDMLNGHLSPKSPLLSKKVSIQDPNGIFKGDPVIALLKFDGSSLLGTYGFETTILCSKDKSGKVHFFIASPPIVGFIKIGKEILPLPGFLFLASEHKLEQWINAIRDLPSWDITVIRQLDLQLDEDDAERFLAILSSANQYNTR